MEKSRIPEAIIAKAREEVSCIAKTPVAFLAHRKYVEYITTAVLKDYNILNKDLLRANAVFSDLNLGAKQNFSGCVVPPLNKESIDRYLYRLQLVPYTNYILDFLKELVGQIAKLKPYVDFKDKETIEDIFVVRNTKSTSTELILEYLNNFIISTNGKTLSQLLYEIITNIFLFDTAYVMVETISVSAGKKQTSIPVLTVADPNNIYVLEYEYTSLSLYSNIKRFQYTIELSDKEIKHVLFTKEFSATYIENKQTRTITLQEDSVTLLKGYVPLVIFSQSATSALDPTCSNYNIVFKQIMIYNSFADFYASLHAFLPPILTHQGIEPNISETESKFTVQQGYTTILAVPEGSHLQYVTASEDYLKFVYEVINKEIENLKQLLKTSFFINSKVMSTAQVYAVVAQEDASSARIFEILVSIFNKSLLHVIRDICDFSDDIELKFLINDSVKVLKTEQQKLAEATEEQNNAEQSNEKQSPTQSQEVIEDKEDVKKEILSPDKKSAPSNKNSDKKVSV